MRISFRLQALEQDGFGAGVAAGCQQAGSLQALGLVAAAQQNGGPQQLKLAFERRHRLGLIGFFDQGQARLVVVAGQSLDGLPAAFFIPRKQRQRGEYVVEFAAHHVVVDHVFGIGRQGHVSAGHGVTGLAVFDDQHLAARSLDGVVGQGLNEGGGFLVWVCRGFDQGLHTRLGVTDGHGLGLLCRQGMRSADAPIKDGHKKDTHQC